MWVLSSYPYKTTKLDKETTLYKERLRAYNFHLNLKKKGVKGKKIRGKGTRTKHQKNKKNALLWTCFDSKKLKKERKSYEKYFSQNFKNEIKLKLVNNSYIFKLFNLYVKHLK